MAVKLSEHFTYKRLLMATLPSIFMMIFVSLYTIVDGIFVANFVGETTLSAVNLMSPFCMIIGSLGFMMGAGGAALTAKTLGEQDEKKAKKIFSCCVYFTIILGFTISLIAFIFMKQIACLLGADEQMLPLCTTYGRILISAEVAFMLQNMFQNFFMVAEKPGMGFAVSVVAGLVNMVLDALFIVVFQWGVVGAAVATITGQIVGAAAPIVYFFSKKNNTAIRFVKTKLDFHVLLKTCTNGSSELLSQVASSVVGIVYNLKLMQLIGQDGVVTYGIIMYISFIFTAVFFGYSIGSAPIVGYNFGAQNNAELKNVLKKSLVVIVSFGAVLTAISVCFAKPLCMIFVRNNANLLELATKAVQLYCATFILMGLNIFASSFFTALNNGLVSAILSTFRTLIFQIATVLILAAVMGSDGIWIAVIISEGLALVMSVAFLIVNKKKYQY